MKENIQERIDTVATLQNAVAYRETNDKFLFCLDLLNISAWRDDAEKWVNMLEDKFDRLNDMKVHQNISQLESSFSDNRRNMKNMQEFMKKNSMI